MLSLSRLPLRSKVSLFFGLLALITTVSLSLVAYTFARTLLLNQRAETAQQRAVDNARRVLLQLLSNDPTTGDWFRTFVRAEPDGGLNFAPIGDAQLASEPRAVDAFPPELRSAVDGGIAGHQRFRFEGRLYIGVGIPIDVGTETPIADEAAYFEAFPLADAEETLHTLQIALAIGSGVTTLFAATVGVWIGRRLLRPLGRVTTAAERIAAGDLDTRASPVRDPDLVPLVESFNGMADAVQVRLEREVRFASDVSHELRSPLTALAAATDVLAGRRDELSERTQQAVDVVVSQVQRFDRMVLDLLEISRIDAGAADLNREPVDVAELAGRVAGRYGFADVPVVVADDVTPTVSIDRLRFERILANLLGNAAEHAGGPVRISIEPAADGFVDIAVEDAGPGVPEDERRRIFERFARGSASRHRVGTGLGLALVLEHANAHGGTAWVEERPGGGSRFIVRVPATSAEDHEAT